MATRISQIIAGQESRKKERRGKGDKEGNYRTSIVRSEILKFKMEVSSWDSTLLERRIERKERLATCLRSTRLVRVGELVGRTNNHVDGEKWRKAARRTIIIYNNYRIIINHNYCY